MRKFAESIESLDTKKNPEARKVIDLAKTLYAKQDVTAAERAQASLYLALYDQVVNEYEGMASKYEEMSKELAKYKASFSPGSGTVGSYEAPAPRNANESLAAFQKGLEGVMAGMGRR